MAKDDDAKTVEIVINGRPIEVAKADISFDAVVAHVFGTADPGATYSVTYERGGNDAKPDGILAPGATVKVKKDMVFSVSATGQS